MNYGGFSPIQYQPPVMLPNDSTSQYVMQSPQSNVNTVMCNQPPPPTPPLWAQNLLVRMNDIVKRLEKLDSIESSIYMYAIKHDIKSLGDRVNEVVKNSTVYKQYMRR